MRSTMMDVPLTVTALMRYGTTTYADAEVVTLTSAGSRRQTYGMTGARVAKLANALRSLGVNGDQRVATLMWNNAEHLEAYLAIPAMGAVLHTLNLRLDPQVIGYIADHAGDDVVIVDPTLVPLLARVLPHAPAIRHVIVTAAEGETEFVPPAELEALGRPVHSYEALLAAQPATFEWPEVDERSAAAMCYTSGTTGQPKGVVYSHRSMHLHSMAVCMNSVFGLSDVDRVLPVVPMFHANAWGLPYAAMLAGSSLIMPDRFLQPEPLVRLIEAERPTLAGAVPTIWNGLLQYVRANGGDLSSLRLVPCGGSAVPHSLMEAYEKELGVTILQAWGMTETSPLGSVAHPPAGLPEEEAWQYRDTAGRLMCQVEHRLIEAERPTIAGAVPTIWNGLLQYVRANGGDLSSLRLVPCGGSAVPHSLMEAYEKELGVTILQAWGMTETSPLGSVAHPPAGLPEEQAWAYRDTAGRLMCQVEHRLMGEGGVELPSDGEAVGEIEVRGPWVTGAYYKDDDPAKFHDGWLRTGDVGKVDRLGYVTLTDRAKDVIKSGGEWISSMELENALMAHPAVAEAAVIGVADDKWGERPLAAIVLAEGATASADELRTFLADQFPRWQLPEHWSFIAEVPKTSVGKFAKTRMRDAYANGEYEIIDAR